MDFEATFSSLEQRRQALTSRLSSLRSMMNQAQSEAMQASAEVSEISAQYSRFSSIITDDEGLQRKQEMVLQSLASQRAAAQNRLQAAQAKEAQCKNGIQQTLSQLMQLRQQYEVLKSQVYAEAEKNKKAASSLMSLKQTNRYAVGVDAAISKMAEKQKKMGNVYRGCNGGIQSINGLLGSNQGGTQRERGFGGFER